MQSAERSMSFSSGAYRQNRLEETLRDLAEKESAARQEIVHAISQEMADAVRTREHLLENSLKRQRQWSLRQSPGEYNGLAQLNMTVDATTKADSSTTLTHSETDSDSAQEGIFDQTSASTEKETARRTTRGRSLAFSTDQRILGDCTPTIFSDTDRPLHARMSQLAIGVAQRQKLALITTQQQQQVRRKSTSAANPPKTSMASRRAAVVREIHRIEEEFHQQRGKMGAELGKRRSRLEAEKARRASSITEKRQSSRQWGQACTNDSDTTPETSATAQIFSADAMPPTESNATQRATVEASDDTTRPTMEELNARLEQELLELAAIEQKLVQDEQVIKQLLQQVKMTCAVSESGSFAYNNVESTAPVAENSVDAPSPTSNSQDAAQDVADTQSLALLTVSAPTSGLDPDDSAISIASEPALPQVFIPSLQRNSSPLHAIKSELAALLEEAFESSRPSSLEMYNAPESSDVKSVVASTVTDAPTMSPPRILRPNRDSLRIQPINAAHVTDAHLSPKINSPTCARLSEQRATRRAQRDSTIYGRHRPHNAASQVNSNRDSLASVRSKHASIQFAKADYPVPSAVASDAEKYARRWSRNPSSLAHRPPVSTANPANNDGDVNILEEFCQLLNRHLSTVLSDNLEITDFGLGREETPDLVDMPLPSAGSMTLPSPYPMAHKQTSSDEASRSRGSPYGTSLAPPTTTPGRTVPTLPQLAAITTAEHPPARAASTPPSMLGHTGASASRPLVHTKIDHLHNHPVKATLPMSVPIKAPSKSDIPAHSSPFVNKLPVNRSVAKLAAPQTTASAGHRRSLSADRALQHAPPASTSVERYRKARVASRIHQLPAVNTTNTSHSTQMRHTRSPSESDLTAPQGRLARQHQRSMSNIHEQAMPSPPIFSAPSPPHDPPPPAAFARALKKASMAISPNAVPDLQIKSPTALPKPPPARPVARKHAVFAESAVFSVITQHSVNRLVCIGDTESDTADNAQGRRQHINSSANTGDARYSATILAAYLQHFSLASTSIDVALRALLLELPLPSLAGKVHCLLKAFSARYHRCNPHSGMTEALVYSVAFALLLLDGSTHGVGGRHDESMSLKQFCSQAALLAPEDAIDTAILEILYDNVVAMRIAHTGEQGGRQSGRKKLLNRFLPQQIGTKLTAAKHFINQANASRIGVYVPLPREDRYTTKVDAFPATNTKRLALQRGVLHVSDIVPCTARTGKTNHQHPHLEHQLAPRGSSTAQPVRLICSQHGLVYRKRDQLEARVRHTQRRWVRVWMAVCATQLYIYHDVEWFGDSTHSSRPQDSHSRSLVDLYTKPLPAPSEIVSLCNAICVVDRQYTKYPYTLQLGLPGGEAWLLRPTSEQAMAAWMYTINCASTYRTLELPRPPNETPYHARRRSRRREQPTNKSNTTAEAWVLRYRQLGLHLTMLREQESQLVGSYAAQHQLAAQLIVTVPIRRKTRDRTLAACRERFEELRQQSLALQRISTYLTILTHDQKQMFIELDGHV